MTQMCKPQRNMLRPPGQIWKNENGSAIITSFIISECLLWPRRRSSSGLARTEGCSSRHVGSATGATIADTRAFWYAVADANKHAFQEKDQRKTQEEESAQVTSGFPEGVAAVCGLRIWNVQHRKRICQVANIAKCRAM